MSYQIQQFWHNNIPLLGIQNNYGFAIIGRPNGDGAKNVPLQPYAISATMMQPQYFVIILVL